MKRRTMAVAAGGIVAVALIGAAMLGLPHRGSGKPAAAPAGPAATSTVDRQTLVKSATLTGELTYGGRTPLTSTAAGIVTWLSAPGSIIRRGHEVLRADNQPVVLLYGPLPVWRPLAEPLKGPDVQQLEQNLAALGYVGFTVDDTFSPATGAAVKRWQKNLGRPQTGVVDKDQIIYAPGAIRIAERLVRVGAPAAGDLVSYSGSDRKVQVSVGASESSWAAKKKVVKVTLPNGRTVPGKVIGISDGEAAPATGDANEKPGVKVMIALDSQKGLGSDQRNAVTVSYVSQERKNVLSVPVPALLALAEGGYGLEVVADGSSKILPVRAGMFADGRVEVSGAGVTEGAVVGMPAE